MPLKHETLFLFKHLKHIAVASISTAWGVRCSRSLFQSPCLLMAVLGTASLLLASPCRILQAADTEEPQRPNIIYMMADDVGWGDSSIDQQQAPDSEVQTGWVETPCLREMAAAGMTFNRFYAASPKCSPTRVSYLTGRQHERQEIDNASRGHLRNGEITLTELAQTQGYITGHFGKWHLGTLDREQLEFDGSRGGWGQDEEQFQHYSTPWGSGYDVGFINERATPTFHPYGNDKMASDTGASRYWTSRTDPILSPRRDRDEQGNPVPLDPRVRGDSSMMLINETIKFIEEVRTGDEPFLANVSFSTVHTAITHAEGYAGAVRDMDTAIGHLRTYLAENGLAENTLLVFTSDNGSAKGIAYNRPGTGNQYTGGLRGRKNDVYEGGIREPGLIEWQGVITAGSTSHAAVGIIDLFPTMLDMWNVEMPDDRPLDGESILPILTGDANARESAMMFYYPFREGHAIISADGRYKVLKPEGANDYRLYDLHADPTEENNLCNSTAASGVGELTHQQLAAQMRTEWETWRENVLTSQMGGDFEYHVASNATNVRLRTEFDLIEEFDNGEGYLVDLRNGQREDSSRADLFVERQYATLRQALAVDSLGANGSYTTDESGTLALDTTVHSFLLHFDPTETDEASGEFSVTFDDAIVGVIGEKNALIASDVLAFAPPRYEGTNIGPENEAGDFIERSGLEEGDTWEISNDGKTITFHLTAESGDYDQVRVLTLSDLPPE